MNNIDINKKVEFIYLSQEDVIAAGGLDMAEIVATVENVFRLHGKDEYIQPPKPVIRWGDAESEETRGRIMTMPSYIGGEFDVAGLKWIPSIPENPKKRGLPRALAVILLSDPNSGVPLAFMDATIISAMRTGAATGVAAKYLARPDSSVAGLIGAGVQNRTQLMALKVVLPHLNHVKIYDLNEEKSHQFAHEMGKQLNLEIKVVNSHEKAIRGSDVFVTATVGTSSYVEKEWVKPGSFQSEISFWDTKFAVLQQADKIVVDDWFQVKHHNVDVSIRAVNAGAVSKDQIYELGKIVCGQMIGRSSETERIIFNPIGISLNDVAVGHLIYQNALKKGIGTTLKLWDNPIWV